MPDPVTLENVLSHLIEESGIPDATLVNIVNERVGRPLLTRRNLQNWKTGLSKKPRTWQPFVGLAIGLRLLRKEANQLLQAASQPSLTELFPIAQEVDQELLQIWEAVEQERQQEVLQEIAQDSVVQEKPSSIRHFLGREDEIDKLIANLKPGKVVALSGAGGVGKTAIATQVLHRLTPNNTLPDLFPDGILFHNFYEQPNSSQIYQHIIERFSFDRSHTTTVSKEAAQRALEGKKALLVLDGAENATDLAAILTVQNNCGVLITSRERVEADYHNNLSVLPPTMAEKLLVAWAEDRADTTEAVQEICDLVGYLPLAIQLIGSYLATHERKATEFLLHLRKARLDALNMSDRQRESVFVVLKKSVEVLSESARLSLAITGILGLPRLPIRLLPLVRMYRLRRFLPP